jgi:hypothetical protein
MMRPIISAWQRRTIFPPCTIWCIQKYEPTDGCLVTFIMSPQGQKYHCVVQGVPAMRQRKDHQTHHQSSPANCGATAVGAHPPHDDDRLMLEESDPSLVYHRRSLRRGLHRRLGEDLECLPVSYMYVRKGYDGMPLAQMYSGPGWVLQRGPNSGEIATVSKVETVTGPNSITARLRCRRPGLRLVATLQLQQSLLRLLCDQSGRGWGGGGVL